MKNIYYFKRLYGIGGTENFLYEMAKMFGKTNDLTILYDECERSQLNRLRKLVRCKKHIRGEKIVCERAFFNFNIDAIEDIESTENYYAFVSHANFEEIGYKPPINHPKLNHFFGVSKFACDRLEVYAKRLGLDIKCELVYNPLTLEPVDKVIHLMSACRLDDKVKGGERTLKFIKALDDYCAKHGTHYVFDIYSNGTSVELNSPNVNVKPGRLDIRPFIADANYVVQLSNDMETYCYTINEALGYGVPVITTPLTVCEELPIPNEARLVCNWDMSNVDEVVEQIFKRGRYSVEYTPPKSDWSKKLAVGKPTYAPKFVKIEAIMDYFDLELHRDVKKGEVLEVFEDRAYVIISKSCAKLLI